VAADQFAARRAALLSRCEREGLEGLIVTSVPNLRYLTGFTGSAGIVLVTHKAVVFFTDFRYRTQAEAEVGPMLRLEVVPSDLWVRLWAVLGELRGIDVVGYEAHVLTGVEVERVEKAETGVRRRATRDLVEQLRVRKDPGEIAAIREAARVAADALEATLPCVRPGMCERDIAVQLERELRVRGSEWHPFPTIAASGPRSALPHGRTTDREVARGEWLLLDFGAQVQGYCADITRTVVVGARADERQRAAYELVREAQAAALRGLRPGLTGREADALARQVIEDRGFGEAFGHSLGHGLGLEVHEAPRLSRMNTEPLPAFATVTVEPGVYWADWGGVRIEDDVVLAPEGAELLSDGRTELRELV
jgi:Xaa-Pro aminopeptidase